MHNDAHVYLSPRFSSSFSHTPLLTLSGMSASSLLSPPPWFTSLQSSAHQRAASSCSNPSLSRPRPRPPHLTYRLPLPLPPRTHAQRLYGYISAHPTMWDQPFPRLSSFACMLFSRLRVPKGSTNTVKRKCKPLRLRSFFFFSLSLSEPPQPLPKSSLVKQSYLHEAWWSTTDTVRRL